MESREHPLSWEALSRIVIFGVIILLVWKALGAVVIIVVALVLTASLHPIVQAIHKKTKFPVLLSTLVVFLILLIPFLIIGFALIPNIGNQLPQILSSIDYTVSHLPYIGGTLSNFSVVEYVGSHSADILASSSTIIQLIISFIATLVLTFYFAYDYDRLFNLFLSILPYKEKDKLKGLILEVSNVTGQFIRGNVIISGITFLVVLI
jgi:predicted PurR-regulated permease PerM